MASIAWIIFGTILIINSAASIVQYWPSNRKCYCVSVENICSSNIQFLDYFCNPYSQAYCRENEIQYCDIPEGTISETCGMKKMTMMHNLVIGQVEVGEYPWQVVILKKKQYDLGYTYISAGVLINKKHVLTAVQKVDLVDTADLIIRLGDWDLSSNEEICSQQDYQPITIIKHPGYNIYTLENNIALIILDRIVPLATSPHINTACLPSEPLHPSISPRRCWVAGWGDSQPLTPGTTKRLRNVHMPIVNRSACQQSFQNILGSSYQLPEKILCAGERKMDSCIIDAGAPLVCQLVSGEMEVVGLVSASSGCQKNVPSLFTDVSKFTSWIHQQVFEYY